MALFVKQENSRTDLQEKIAAELREKALKNSLNGGEGGNGEGETDHLEDSVYLEGTKETTSLAFVWALLAVAAIIAIGYFLFFT